MAALISSRSGDAIYKDNGTKIEGTVIINIKEKLRTKFRAHKKKNAP